MKKTLLALAVVVLLGTTPVLAADYPTDVSTTTEGGIYEIRKTYELPPNTEPSEEARQGFTLDGYSYTLMDMLRREMPERELREYTETVTLDSTSRELADVLPLLPEMRDVTTEDGLCGTLTLDAATITVEPAGYRSNSWTVTATRSYPNLSDMDMQYIPKTTTENGRTLSFASVDWRYLAIPTGLLILCAAGFVVSKMTKKKGVYEHEEIQDADYEKIPDDAQPDAGGGSIGDTVPSTGYTAVTNDLYYSAGHLGTLNIPAIGLSVKVYQGTDSAALRKGAGHFESTSIWDENVAFAGHNRGVNDHFGRIHTLDSGDTITLTTKLGTRTYQVYSVRKVSVNDVSMLEAASDNIVTLVTCVMNQPDYRWCVQARQTW